MKHNDLKEIEETVYKSMTLDLCPACQRACIKDPIQFHQQQGGQ